jgi:hypothetical protein
MTKICMREKELHVTGDCTAVSALFVHFKRPGRSVDVYTVEGEGG